jgi:hypothetical protein
MITVSFFSLVEPQSRLHILWKIYLNPIVDIGMPLCSSLSGIHGKRMHRKFNELRLKKINQTCSRGGSVQMNRNRQARIYPEMWQKKMGPESGSF